ncbi:mechanosensitive ion channel family protein [Bdellovibrio svalbardensis]|uniref:Mechanosensitive ion channel family protein n=1 Tax=Bdellovibrio svalbardensis TaxID=2972972 RepID=A0ABT6DGI5_9BACT|nr:mechanosensitive ion channel family protein [Bdellovibrio svalbardensis]MDG0815923.1 mechanosensitive ion channel family protein [Bdellovibrio svalbardensis]
MEKFLFEESHIFSAEIAALLKHTMLIMPNWKWLALVAFIIIGVLIRPLIQFGLKEIKLHNPWTKKFPKSFTSYLFRGEIERPAAWVILGLIWFACGDSIELTGKFQTYYEHFLKAFIAIHVIRLIYYAVDALGSVFADIAAKTESTMDDQLVPFASKILKILVVVLGFLTVLQSFGLNVMSLLAGLGLGGLALALAAQDTAANLFGSVTILVDNPCKIGDWVKVKDVEGTVEEIGFRSTRIRTFYNSVITIPNGTMAKETIDNMGVRPARRIRQILGLTYETPIEKIEEFCDRVRYLIIQDEKVITDTVTVAFNNFNSSSLDVLVNFHLQVFTGPEELAHQQRIFLEIVKIAAELKVDFAYPTNTVYYRGAQG